MSFLKNLFGEKPPQWAQPISPQLFKKFQATVQEIIESNGLAAEIDWQAGTATMPATGFVTGFQNVIRVWIDSQGPDQDDMLKEDLTRLLTQQAPISAKLIDCLESLLPKVHDFQYCPPDYIVSKSFGQFLLASLVIDNEFSTVSVIPSQAEESQIPTAELFEIAQQNLWKNINPAIERKPMPSGVLTIVSHPFFGASFLSVLEKLTEADTKYWVSAPARNILLIFQPTNDSHDSLTNFFKLTAGTAEANTAYYNLPFVLEYRSGEFRDLCYVTENGTIQLFD